MLQQLNKLRPLFDRRDKLQYAGLSVLMGIGALLEVTGVGVVPAFVATLAVPDKVRSYEVVDQALNTLGITTSQELVVWGAVGLILVFTFRAAYLVFLSYIQIRMTEHHRVRISRRLFTAYMRAPYEFHLGRNTAELLRNAYSETKTIVTGIINPMLTVVLNGLMTLCIVALLIASTPWSAMVAIVTVGGGGWAFLRTVRGRMKEYGKKARTERKKCIQAVNQGLGGLKDARVLGVEKSFVDDFFESIARNARYERFRNFISKLGTPLLELIAVIGLMFVVLTMVMAGTDLKNMVPMLGLFGAAIVRLRSSTSKIVSSASQLRYNMASVDAVVDDLRLLKNVERKKTLASETDAKRKDEEDGSLPLESAIVFNDVSYSYPDTDTPAVRDISLIIERRQSVGFVGATGSGKTTIINLLLGLLNPQEGEIAVDGVDIHSDLRNWQDNIGYIPQSIFLLDDTIRRNVAFGVPEDEIDEEKLWMAIRAAQIEDHVLDLSKRTETVVGEHGVRLSGGQRQRVGLARALYHNPEVLVMDEATSALDNETESLVMEALKNLREDRTLVMIAHRLSTVRDCDKLFFLKEGQIEAVGTYEELCAMHGDFRKMAQA